MEKFAQKECVVLIPFNDILNLDRKNIDKKF